VYGVLANYSVPPVSTYVVDGSSPVTYPGPVPSLTLFNQLFYQSPTLDDGDHTLVVRFETQSGWLWLDYFIYTPSTTTSPSDIRTSTSTITTHAMSQTLITGGNTTPGLSSADTSASVICPSSPCSESIGSSAQAATASSTSIVVASTRKSSPAGAIAGGVMGGLAAVLLVLVLFFYRKRRNSAITPTPFRSSRLFAPPSPSLASKAQSYESSIQDLPDSGSYTSPVSSIHRKQPVLIISNQHPSSAGGSRLYEDSLLSSPPEYGRP